MSKLKEIPQFDSEEEAREFWSTHDSTEYVDWSKAIRAEFPNLERSNVVTIPIEVPRETYERMQVEAKRKGVALLNLATAALRDRLVSLFK
jgi:hypothetical protein